MSVDLHLTSDDALGVSVSYYGDEDVPWCAVHLNSEKNHVTIFITEAQLRDVIRNYEIEVRAAVSVCTYAECDEPATTTITVSTGDNGVNREGDYCHEHARAAAMNAYTSGVVSSIKLVPIAS